MSHPRNECRVEDCGKPVEAIGLCRGHRARHSKGLVVEVPLRIYGNPARTFAEAMFAFTDAADNDEEAYFRAWKRVCTAGRRYFGTK